MSNHLTATYIKNVKKLAKKIKSDLNVSHSEALEIVAKREGYPSYHSLISRFNNQNTLAIKLIKLTRKSLIEVVSSEAGLDVIENSRSIVGRYHRDSDLVKVTLSVLLDVFDKGVKHDGVNIDAERSILAWSIDKEAIKELGYQHLKSDDLDSKVVGVLFVALGHFYRSAVSSMVSQPIVHPNFETYLADWVRSVGLGNKEVITTLLGYFPGNPRNGIPTGTSYWRAA
ncbi:hypothetical protein FHO46_17485 [Vibrio cholerae]|nr:hypothetical protein [Vibrio cholerae]EGR0939165.1 hypothetical protein [Vibrio cholerae]EIA0769868.1 hypothetical protein [Vibrio cholerae]EID0160692.1 hypothetical protein [Vibrio cholerae]EJL6350458.1 hypothetical protein [Vibrio cholerae]